MIALTTDFGGADWYVGAMKAVIAIHAPGTPMVDLCHGVPPGAISSGAFVLAHNVPYFPAGTVHLAVVDPTVGSSRRAVALRTRGQLLVGPDNGLFGPFAADEGLQVVELRASRVAYGPMSATFHGRDLFAAAAARLAKGESLESLGLARAGLQRGESWWRWVDGKVHARVLWIDRFGNVITGVPETELDGLSLPLVVEFADRSLEGLHRAFFEVAPGEPLAYIGSSGTLEIAVRDGNAAEVFGMQVGAELRIGSANAGGTTK